ncbi:MAG: ATP synthase epsilon chain, partial [uncultured Rubrobacteraceae bacterium]
GRGAAAGGGRPAAFLPDHHPREDGLRRGGKPRRGPHSGRGRRGDGRPRPARLDRRDRGRPDQGWRGVARLRHLRRLLQGLREPRPDPGGRGRRGGGDRRRRGRKPGRGGRARALRGLRGRGGRREGEVRDRPQAQDGGEPHARGRQVRGGL